MSLTTILAAALAACFAIATAFGYGHHVGAASVELANTRAIAEANAKAVDVWKSEAARQARADADQRVHDASADTATAQALRDITTRYAALAQKPAPPARCDLSPAWITAYNEAR